MTSQLYLELNLAKVRTYREKFGCTRLLPNYEQSVDCEPVQNGLYPGVILRNSAITDEGSQLVNDPCASSVDRLHVAPKTTPRFILVKLFTI